jgi:hypothetical protein
LKDQIALHRSRIRNIEEMEAAVKEERRKLPSDTLGKAAIEEFCGKNEIML